MKRLQFLENYVVALIKEKVLSLNPRDTFSVNVKKVLGAVERDLKIVLENVGRQAAGAAIRTGGMYAEDFVRGFFENLAERVVKK